MKNKELFKLSEELKRLNFTGKIGYAIAKNRRLIEQEIETLNETIKTLPDFDKYDRERIELAKKHAKKDEKGKELTEDIKENGKLTNHFIIENQKEFDKEFEELKETHKKAIDTRKSQIDDFNKLLEEEANLTFHTITEDQIPETATANEVYTLLKLIK